MIRLVIIRINVVRPLCDSLVGENHTFKHRAGVGIIVMLLGVLIAKTFGHHEIQAVAVIADAVGYGLHGVGLIPFAEAIISQKE